MVSRKPLRAPIDVSGSGSTAAVCLTALAALSAGLEMMTTTTGVLLILSTTYRPLLLRDLLTISWLPTAGPWRSLVGWTELIDAVG